MPSAKTDLIKRQLEVYHNPFSMATKQPKIPDSKVTESLGFSTRIVGEVKVAEESTDGILHILLCPNMNAPIFFMGSQKGVDFVNDSPSQRDPLTYSWAPRLDDSNALIYAGGVAGGNVGVRENYARWRYVSGALRLNLLNVDDEDDGWFEACRVTEGVDTQDYYLTGTDAGAGADSTIHMTVNPTGILTGFSNRNLANERSYCTGTLREIGNYTWSLNPIGDDHDFNDMPTDFRLETTDIDDYDNGTNEVSFAIGRTNVKHLISKCMDRSMDMIYIRVHGRVVANPGAATRNFQDSRSRLHYHCIANQEITFGSDERDSRFHTTSATHDKMDVEIDKKKENQSAGHHHGARQPMR